MAESEPKFIYAMTTVKSKTSAAKIKILFFSCNLPVSNLRIETFKIKILRIKTHSLRIQFFSLNHRLKSLLQILITCLKHNKLRSPVIKVATLITYRQTIQYDKKILRVVEHKILLFKIQKTSSAAQGSKTQACKQNSVKKTRHLQ